VTGWVVEGVAAAEDFFISYTGADVAWAEWVAQTLEDAGYKTVLQAWDFRPGQDFLQQMHQATQQAARTIAVLSPAYLGSSFGEAEWRMAFANDPTGELGLLLPVRVAEVTPPGLLRSRTYLDLVGLDEQAAAERLLAGVRPGRAKPKGRRPFPGGQARLGGVSFPGRRPAIFEVPPRSPHFTGRGDLLHALRRHLVETKTGAVVQAGAVHGLGGVGKTQLAVEYAHRYAADYDLVWWIPAEQPATISGRLAQLGRRLGLAELPSLEEQVGVLFDALGLRDRWLLVYDNAQQPADLAGLWPPAGGGQVLVTSRNPAWSGVAATVPVDVLPREQAVAFLVQRTRSSDRASLEALAGVLGDLPLALEQAAAYLEETTTTPREYLELLRDRAKELFALGHPATSEQTIATTWTVSLKRLRSEAPAAEDLLNLCAFLAPDDLPRALLTEHVDGLPERLAGAVGDRLGFQQVLGALRRYSLATVTADAVSVHRLIRKSTVSRQAAAPGGAGSRRRGWGRSGGGLQGDLVAQRLQLADVVALAALGVDAALVEARAQIVEAGGRVGQQVPDDDQDGAADRHDGPLGAAPPGDAPVALPQEGVGPPSGHGGLAQHSSQVGVAVAGGGLALGPTGRLFDAGGKPCPGGQVARGGEAAHIDADLGDDHLRGRPADPTDLIQLVDRRPKRGDLGVDLAVQFGDVDAGLVDAGKHPLQQEGVMVAEAADEGLGQLGGLGAQAGACQLRQDFGVTLPGDQRGQHGPAGDTEDVAGDHAKLDLGVLQQLLHPVLLRGADRDQVGAVAGQVPQPPDRWWWDEAGAQHLPLGQLAQPHRVQPVGLGPPRQVLDITRVYQPHLKPMGFQQIEDRLPVVAGGLHHHPGHPKPGQPIGQHQQPAGHRLVGGDLLQPLAGLGGAWHPHTADQLRLADIQRRDPPDDLLGVLRLLQHPASSPLVCHRHGHPREPQAGRKLIRVLKATLKGPNAAPSVRLVHGLTRP
jgi:hypothetical protein